MVAPSSSGLDSGRVRMLCFDVDGTLSDTDNVLTARLATLIPRGLVQDRRRAARSLVVSLEGPANTALSLADRLGLDQAMVGALNWAYRHRGHSRTQHRLIDGVDELLARLQGRYPMAVVSARDERSTLRFLDEHQLRDRFDLVVTALTTGRTKPYPDPIDHAATVLGVRPQDCLMIGDTTVDMIAARRAQAQSVGVLCGFGRRGELIRSGAGAVIASTAELEAVLDGRGPRADHDMT
ncbi:MAG: HAD family hydrolase [Actinomycetales bacterium]